MGLVRTKWNPEGWVCPHCGAPNPDKGDKCGNCDENPFIQPKKFFTANELRALKTIQHRNRSRRKNL